MTGKRRGTKRKSEDFIYEVDDKDLSTDEDDSVKNPSCKISKLESTSTKKSKTKHNLSVDVEKSESIDNEKSESVDNEKSDLVGTDKSESLESEVSKDLVPMKTELKDEIQNNAEENTLENEKPNKMKKGKSTEPEVIEIEDSIVDQDCSVVLIEEPVPIMVLSDGEEGEILEASGIVEDLEIVDEVYATPQKKSPVPKTPVDDTLKKQSPTVEDEEFQVVDETGYLQMPKEDEIDSSTMPTEKRNLMNISFSCQKAMNDYGHLLIKFLKSFPEIETTTEKLCIKVNESEIFEEIKTPKKKNKKKKAKKDLFVVDTNPSSRDDNLHSSNLRYTSKFTIEEEAEAEKAPSNSRSAQTCFNCGKEHALRDCNAPRNQQRINQARQQFLDRNKTVRYHGEQNQKLAEFKPGVISESLRNALGLHKNEIPEHIYRMRNLGYPPGWLEEAKVLPSDLTMFNIDGEKVEHIKKKTSIDPDKIVEYPGFNVPLKKGYRDDFKRHNVKPYNKSMHKSSMIKHYEDLYQQENLEESSSDMDISEIKEIETEPKSLEKMVKDRASASVNSPSLVDLEEKKKELIDELNADQEEKSETNEKEENVPEVKIDNISLKEESTSAVKNTSFGTPILKSSSPYSRLPNPDNFSVGVSPVIDFENLPNSTGKYEELSKVLNKVRMTMKNKF